MKLEKDDNYSKFENGMTTLMGVLAIAIPLILIALLWTAL